MTINETVLYFFLYSFLGWVYESVMVSIREKKWSNRGFLIGPICPIYGFGAVLCVLICSNINIWLTFLLCMAGSAVLEYSTAYALEKLFHASWWDYSNMPLNLNGYICLPASLAFGAAGVLISHAIHPILAVPIEILPSVLKEIIALLLVGICSADLTLTVSSLTDFAVKMKDFETRFNKAISDKYDEIENTVNDKIANVKKGSLLTDAIRDSIIEQELKKANLRLSQIQFNAVKNIRKFKKEGASSENRVRIKELMVRLSAKAKEATKKNKNK